MLTNKIFRPTLVENFFIRLIWKNFSLTSIEKLEKNQNNDIVKNCDLDQEKTLLMLIENLNEI